MDSMFTPYPVDSHSAGCYYLTRRGMYNAIKLEGKYTWSEHQIFRNLKTYTYTRPLFDHEAVETTIHVKDHRDQQKHMLNSAEPGLNAIITYFISPTERIAYLKKQKVDQQRIKEKEEHDRLMMMAQLAQEEHDRQQAARFKMQLKPQTIDRRRYSERYVPQITSNRVPSQLVLPQQAYYRNANVNKKPSDSFERLGGMFSGAGWR